MTTPIAGIRIVVETAEGVKNFQDIQRAALATPAAFRVATQSAASYGATVQQTMATAAAATNTATAAVEASTRAQKTAQQAAAGFGQNIQRLREPLTALATYSTGAAGPLASVGSLLASMAVGTPLVVGVAAGMAAIGLAWRLLGDDVRETNERLERGQKLFESVVEGRRLLDDYRRTLGDAQQTEAQLLATQREIAALDARTAGQPLGATTDQIFQRSTLQGQLKGYRDELTSIGEALVGYSTKLATLNVTAATAAQRRAEEEAKELRERRDQLQELEDAERRAGQLRVDETTRAIQKQVDAADHLTAAEKERLAIALRRVAALKEEADALAAYQAALRHFNTPVSPAVTGPPEIVRQGLLAGVGNGLTLQPSHIEELTGALTRLRDRTGQTAKLVAEEAAVRDREARALELFNAAGLQVLDTLGLLPEELVAVAGGFGQLAAAIQRQDALGGAVSVAGILASVGDTLFDFSGQAAEAARNLAEQKRQFAIALEDFATIGLSTFEQQARGLQRQFEDLVRQAAGASGFETRGLAVDDIIGNATAAKLRPRRGAEATEFLAEYERLQAALAEREAELLRLAEAQRDRVLEDLRVQALAAEGNTAGAEALQRQLDLERRLADLRDQLGPAYTDDLEAEVRRVDALRQEAEALAKAEEESRRRADVAATLTQRELAARQALGEDVAARIREAERAAQVEAAVRQGYTESELARLRYIQGLEDEAAALAATRAETERRTAFAQDLEGRRLVATEDPGAEAYQRALAQQREVAQAVAAGLDDAAIAQLRYVQHLEDEKVSRDALLEQQRRTLDLLRQETRAQEDLNTRKLRAQGLDAAADELALLARQRQELEDAQGKGFSAGFVADLLSTQALERDAFAEERRRRQQEAFDRAASSAFGLTTSYAESSGRVDLAIGASESTVNRLAGLNTSMLGVQQRFLPFLESLDRRLARLEALLAQRAGLSPGDLDDALGLAVLRAEQAQGLAPTN